MVTSLPYNTDDTNDTVNVDTSHGPNPFYASYYDEQGNKKIPSAITPQALAPTTAITPPTAPTPEPIDTTGGQTTIDQFQAYLKSIPPPPSAATAEADLYAKSGVEGFQGTANIDFQALQKAQDRLAAINAQLGGLQTEQTAVPVQLQEDIARGGANVTKAGVAPQQTAQLRNIALRALPLQAQALGAQAEVAAAQGRAELSQNILQQAQNRLDRVFQIHQTDSTNQYNYRLKLIDKAYESVSALEKNKLDDLKATLTSNQTQRADALGNAQSIANSIFKDNPALAAQITALTPPNIGSKTFEKDLEGYNAKISALQAQYMPKADTKNQIIGSDTTGYSNVITDASGNVISVTPITRSGTLDVPVSANATPETKNLAQTAGLVSGFSSDKARASFMKSINPLIQQGNDKGLAEKIIGQTLANIPDADTRKRTIGGFTIAQNLTRLSGLINEYESAGGETGFFKGNIQKLYEKVGQIGDPALAGLGVQILNTLDILARSRTGAVITESEEALYNRMLPSIDKVGELNTALSDGLKESLMFDVATQLRFNITEDGYNHVKNALPDVFNPITKDFLTDEEMATLESKQATSTTPTLKTEPAGFWNKFLKVFGF